MPTLINWLNDRIHLPTDSPTRRAKKTIVMLALLVSPMSMLLQGFLFFAIGLPTAGWVYMAFVVLLVAAAGMASGVYLQCVDRYGSPYLRPIGRAALISFGLLLLSRHKAWIGSQGKADVIQVTEVVKRKLEGAYQFEAQPPTHIKGKGQMVTYFLQPQ